MIRRLIAAVSVGVVLLPPAAAGAATKTLHVSAGEYQDQLASNHVRSKWFYPWADEGDGLEIHRNDKIKFVANAYHEVEIVAARSAAREESGKRQHQPWLKSVQPDAALSGIKDAAGQEFWFNGQPSVRAHPVLLKSNFGKSVNYSGGTTISSGLPAGGTYPQTWTVKFTKVGKYKLFCIIHPGMNGAVNVKAKGKPITSNAEDAARLDEEYEQILGYGRVMVRQANAADRQARRNPPQDNTIRVGLSRGGTDLHRMVPANATVPAGTTLTFAPAPRGRDFHTVSFGPEPYLEEVSFVFHNITWSFYGSEPPGTTAGYRSSLHGNGFWNSGLLSGRGAMGLPKSAQLIMEEEGIYYYYCLLHDDMKGTITVE